MISLNRPPGEKPSHQSFRRHPYITPWCYIPRRKSNSLRTPKRTIILRMKAFETVVAAIVVTATVLALVKREIVADFVLPIVYSWF